MNIYLLSRDFGGAWYDKADAMVVIAPSEEEAVALSVGNWGDREGARPPPTIAPIGTSTSCAAGVVLISRNDA